MALILVSRESWYPLMMSGLLLSVSFNLLKIMNLGTAQLAFELPGALVQAPLEKREISPIVRWLREVAAI